MFQESSLCVVNTWREGDEFQSIYYLSGNGFGTKEYSFLLLFRCWKSDNIHRVHCR